jgi:hypothetical protein
MNPGPGGSDTSLGVENGTSPAITSTAPASTGTGTEIASIAESQSQLGVQDDPAGTYCNPYSAYWQSGATDCGNSNRDEPWCADFAAWVWAQAGVQFIYGGGSGEIDAGAITFYSWAVANGTWHPAGSGYTPQPGDAVVYALDDSYAQHVAIVTSYTPGDAGPNVVNGDWWPSGNGAVVAETDQTSVADNGVTYPILGYASP